MVVVDLDSNISLTEVFRKIESGETVRLMRGEHFVALVTPAAAINEALWESCNWDDAVWLAAAEKASAEALAAAFPDDDFSDWDPSHATR